LPYGEQCEAIQQLVSLGQLFKQGLPWCSSWYSC
jgi:hypothetical protein